MEFEIDVSGTDIFEKDYTICTANKDGIIKGFKMTPEFISVINSRFGQGIYRYQKSKNGRILLKVRLYSILIYFLFKSIKINESITLAICRDFNGRETDIKSNLIYLFGLLGIKIERIDFCKLGKGSIADKYAYLMRKDTKNQLKTYVHISIEDVEKYLKK